MMVLEANQDLKSEHIGFHDLEYRKRREYIVSYTKSFDPVIQNFPKIQYLEHEIQTWNKVFTTLESLYPSVACYEYNQNFQLLVKEKIFQSDKIPDLELVSKFIESKTGFRLHPVSGLLSTKQFLSGLANKTFYCTQYIRHHDAPFYTPEPDIVHEMLGHIPMFLDKDICDFSYLLGNLAQKSSDTKIKDLEKLYWFTIEFGVLTTRKIYGAGILSSISEIKKISESKDVEMIQELNLEYITKDEPLITNIQDHYYSIESISDLPKIWNKFLQRFC